MNLLNYVLKRIRSGKINATLLGVFVVCVIPSIISFIIAKLLGFPPAVTNIDLFAILIFSVLLGRKFPRIATIGCSLSTMLIMSIPILSGLGIIYLGTPAAIVEYILFISDWPWIIIGFVLFIVAIVTSIYYQLVTRIGYRQAMITPIIMLSLLTGIVDLTCGSNKWAFHPASCTINISTSSVIALYALSKINPRSGSILIHDADRTMAADLNDIAQKRPHRILSIAVESWGYFNDERYNKLIMAPLYEKLSSSYKINVSKHTYQGATLSGEVRELCGYLSDSVPTLSTIENYRRSCVPFLLRDLNYATWAGHANKGTFYDRIHIYPALGFEFTTFEREFNRLNGQPSYCESNKYFSSVCDSIVIHSAIIFLESHDHSFAHIMTLDTHLPLRKQQKTTVNNECETIGKSKSENIACAYINVFRNALDDIALQITSSINPPDLIYIYGDHRPPFAFSSERSLFEPKSVPFVKLNRS